MKDINIDWQGPFTLEEALQLHTEVDYGLYQYYGDHPIYGQNVLLYLGSAIKQPFGKRLAQHNWRGCQNFRVQGGLRITRMVERIDPGRG